MMNEYLAAKLAVMKDVKYLRKNKTMQGGGSYTYIGESMIVRRLRRAMIDNGISVAPINMELVSREQFQTAKGGTSHSTILKVTWRFSHTSGQSEDVTTIGEAADHGDKASNKAMTAAKKYALLLWGLIETGDDPDDTHSDQFRRQAASKNGAVEPAKPNQSEEWKTFAKWANAQIPKLFASMDQLKAEVLLSAGSDWNAETLKTCTDAKVFDDIKQKILSRSKVAALAN